MKLIVCLLCAFLSLFSMFSVSLADEMENGLYAEDVYLEDWEQAEVPLDPSVKFVCAHPYVRLRRTDSTDLPYVDKMPYGSMVTALSTQINDMGEEWSLVCYNGQYGYCMTKYLTTEMEVSASNMHPRTMEEAFGSTVLQRGNKTPSYRVKNLQLCLMAGGFLNDDKGADGYFGKNTYKALCAFQKAQGLDPAGRAGKTSKTRLWYLYADYLMENGFMQ